MANYKIIRCPHCGQQLRIPSDKEIQVSCPKCKHSFKANVKEKREKTFVDQLYHKEESRYPKEDSFIKYNVIRNYEHRDSDSLLVFMTEQIVANKKARHFNCQLYYYQMDQRTEDMVKETVMSFDNSLNWTVIKGLIGNKIREYNLGVRSFTVTIKNEPFERMIKEDKKDFWGRPKYKTVQDIKHTIWISASW